jgi:hypothetical protein
VRSLALLLFALAACTPRAGDPCKPGKESCADRKTALACLGGRVTSVPCRGPAGCTRTGEVTSCDNAIAVEGDPCPSDDDNACSLQGDALLVCRGGRFGVAERCRGERGCKVALDRATCDVGIAVAGDACREEGNRACSVDRRSMLACAAGKFQVILYCHGALGCRVGSEKVDCDDSIADVGDPCEAPNDAACASDGKRLLGCKDHKLALIRACATKCEARDGTIACD